MFFDKMIFDIFTARDAKFVTHTQTPTCIYVSVRIYVCMHCVHANMRFVSLVVKKSNIYLYCDIAEKMLFFRYVIKKSHFAN